MEGCGTFFLLACCTHLNFSFINIGQVEVLRSTITIASQNSETAMISRLSGCLLFLVLLCDAFLGSVSFKCSLLHELTFYIRYTCRYIRIGFINMTKLNNTLTQWIPNSQCSMLKRCVSKMVRKKLANCW